MRDAVFFVDFRHRREAERTVKALQMGLRMQADRRARPLRANMRKRPFEHRIAQTDAAEFRCREHTANADIRVVRIRQQHAQITRERRPLFTGTLGQ